MRKTAFALAATLALIPSLANAEGFNPVTEYTKFKNWFQEKTDITYSFYASFLMQTGTPDGGKSIFQTIYNPNITWNIFDSDKYGSGSINFGYSAVQYWSKANGNYLSNNINIANQVNDNSINENTFSQLTYTQTFANNMFGVTVGQFPLWLFDGGQYGSNQQTSFINMALSQNASSTYPLASLGAYVTWNPTPTISISAGLQDANNISGSRISTRDLNKGDWTGFGYISWSPKIEGLGSSQFTLLYYNQPSVRLQPDNSEGWSFNFTQNINDTWGVFGRFNTATGDIMPISSSIVLGGVMNNPLKRNPLDQIGLAVAFNEINDNVVSANFGTKVRKTETVIEGFWNWGITEYMQVTPDVQFYINPALDSKQDTATVFSLRLTFML